MIGMVANFKGTKKEKQEMENAIENFCQCKDSKPCPHTLLQNQRTIDYWLWMRRDYHSSGYWLRSEYTGRHKRIGEPV